MGAVRAGKGNGRAIGLFRHPTKVGQLYWAAPAHLMRCTECLTEQVWHPL
jgi:hypothetical protein